MHKPTVIFSDLRTSYHRNLLDKIEALLTRVGVDKRIGKGDRVAVKLHFGELGNTSFIRPVLVRRVVTLLKDLGAKPFLTDTNTLYVGTRSDAVSHMETAVANGFAYSVVGAPIVIADGLKGTTAVKVPVKGAHFNEVSIASEIVNADAVVGLAHFKGHELSGFGGALKNIGMGCASREGKMEQHSSVSPKVARKECVDCGECFKWCAHEAISEKDDKAYIDPDKCVGCGECIHCCPQEAIKIRWSEGPVQMQKKMADYVLGALADKENQSVFLNFATQISPACDCYGRSDSPIVPDIGILASTDPVALDQASVDMVNGMAGNANTALTENLEPGSDKFGGLYPKVDWSVQLESAQSLGIGSREYELQELPKA